MITLELAQKQLSAYLAQPKHFYVAIITVIVISLYTFYRLITRPLNRIRRLGDVGLYFGEPELKGVFRERQIERLARLRRVGELPPVYPNGWFCIAESSEIKPKTIKEITVFGQFFSLVRSESGNVFMIDSYCPHLGANFNVGGKVVNDNCVQCPFHGWKFSAETGKCVEIPYNEGTIPEQAKVATWPVREVNQHIYVWYHSEGLDPEWEIPEIEEMLTGQWQFGGRTEHEVMCHCQEIPENGADIAHLNYLHLAGPNDGSDIVKLDLNDSEPAFRHVWSGAWQSLTGENRHIGVMDLFQHMTFKGFRIPLTTSILRAEQLGPGIVLMRFDFGSLGKGVVFQNVTPEQPLLQKVRFKMYSNCPRWFNKFFLISEARQFERDVFVWSNKKFIKNPLLVKNDGPIMKHRRWFNQFYTDNSPRMLSNGGLSNRAKSPLDW